jgi:sugar transferase (PEP-CTERM system associated)
MSEADDSLSEFVGLGAGLEDDRTPDWLMLARHDDASAEHVAVADSWEACATAAPSFPVRWTWRYRPPGAVLNGNGTASHEGRRKKVNVLVVGDGPLADRIVAELERVNGYTLAGHLHKVRMPEGGPELIDVLPEECDPLDRLDKIAVREHVGCIVVTMSEQRGDLPMEQLVACRFKGVRIENGVGFYERLTKKIPLEGLKPSYFVFQGGFRWPSDSAKRSLDVLLALLALAITTPLFVLLPFLIKLSSPGPVFYRQHRLGRHGRPFRILKFRSMSHDAEMPGRAMWAQEEDPRVTPIGRFMRQYRLDELPQLLNVLRGEMSMVGPRPERPEFIKRLSRQIPFYAYRLQVKPGITGWAQVRFRYGATIQDAAEKLQYDLYYIKHMSLRLDGLIALKTIRTVLFQSGAR